MKKIFAMLLVVSYSFSILNVNAAPIEDVKTVDMKLLKKLPESIKKNDPLLVLVNSRNTLKTEVDEASLVYYAGNLVHEAIFDDLSNLLTAAENDGYYYRIVSAYRSMSHQEVNRQNALTNYLNAGYDYETAQSMVDDFYAPANASEHSTGLALDLLGNDWGDDLTGTYATTASAAWLAENAPKYGFILRYPEGKTHLTGYHFEPWHFRYVGKEAAVFMSDNQLTLEEFWALLNKRYEY